MGKREELIPPHGGYRRLKSFQVTGKTEIRGQRSEIRDWRFEIGGDL